PETRVQGQVVSSRTSAGDGLIDRLTVDSYLDVPEKYVPPFLRPFVPLSRALVPSVGGSGKAISIGPFPQGFPVGLITNADLLGADLSGPDRQAHQKKLFALVERGTKALKTEKDFRAVATSLVEDLLAVSKCRDFVVNKGHYFGTDYFTEEPGLTPYEKYVLIEFLKTL